MVVCSDTFRIARSSACSVFETLFDIVVRISLMYTRNSVGGTEHRPVVLIHEGRLFC